MFRRWRYRKKCRALAAAAAPEALKAYLEAGGAMRPGSLHETPLIAADLELTGLDPAKDQISSVGWTRVDEGRSRRGSNRPRCLRRVIKKTMHVQVQSPELFSGLFVRI